MTRVFENDFHEFETYLEQYNLQSVCKSEDYKKALRKSHKRFLAFLYATSFVLYRESESTPDILNDSYLCQNSSKHSLLLSVKADLNSSIFCSTHGTYKAANVCLRSSIENFIRYIAGIWITEAYNEMSIFNLFDYSRSVLFFTDESLGRLRAIYKELCKYVHSDDSVQCDISVLAQLPHIDTKQLNLWEEKYSEVCKLFSLIMVTVEPKIFLNSSAAHRDVIGFNLPKKCKGQLMECGKILV